MDLEKKTKKQLGEILDSLSVSWSMRDKKAVLISQVQEARKAQSRAIKTRRSPSPPRQRIKDAVSPVKVESDANIFQQNKFAKAVGSVGKRSPASKRRSRGKSPARRSSYKPSPPPPVDSDDEEDDDGGYDDDNDNGVMFDDDENENTDDAWSQRAARLTRLSTPPSDLFHLPRNSYLAGGTPSSKRASNDVATPRAGRLSLASLRPSWLTPASEERVGRSKSRSPPRTRGKSPARKVADGMVNISATAWSQRWPIIVLILVVLSTWIYFGVDWSSWQAASLYGTAVSTLRAKRGEALCNPDVQYRLSAEALLGPADTEADDSQTVVRKLAIDRLRNGKEDGIQYFPNSDSFEATKETAQPPFLCATRLYFNEHREVAAFILLIIVGLLWLLWRRRQQNKRIERINDLANQVFTMLKAQQWAYRNGQSAEPYIALVHLRDVLTKKHEQDVWEEALDEVRGNSCVSERGQYIAGAQCDVFEWVAPLNALQTNEEFRSPINSPSSRNSPYMNSANVRRRTSTSPVSATSYPVL